MFPQTMYTCSQLTTSISKRIQTLYGKEVRQDYSQAGARMDRIAIQNITLPFPFNLNQPMPDDHFIFSSF